MKYVFIIASIVLSHAALAQTDTTAINTFIDNWHLAATQANAKKFFESMDDNSIYIGTDQTERWTKTEFEKFAKPFFDKGKAWSFTAFDRDLHVTNDRNYAWFSELLNTWMGVCRGSGVLKMTNAGWKIEQYHLSVTVPNEMINSFISLIQHSGKSGKAQQAPHK